MTRDTTIPNPISPRPAQHGVVVLTAIVLLEMIWTYAPGAPPTLVYEGSQRLPNVLVNGEPLHIHTQGLLVSERHFYVTGRLEVEPRRALLLRFARDNPQQYEYRDITPPAAKGASGQLDHPGGFDGDGRRLFVPIGLSQPGGPSVVVSLNVSPETPLAKATVETMFSVNDHIGAVAWDRSNGILYGANWDTKRIYAWNMEGRAASEIDQQNIVSPHPPWRLAVQDWKGVGDRLPNFSSCIIAGGLDKSSQVAPNQESVIELLDVKRRQSVWRVYPHSADGYEGPMTREGFDVFGGRVFLLPADLGRGARVFRYRLSLQ